MDKRKLISKFYENKNLDQLFLKAEREFAGVWPYICKCKDIPVEMLEGFKDLVVAGVEMQWGPCDFIFREDGKIFVRSKDDKQMELISGKKYHDEYIQSSSRLLTNDDNLLKQFDPNVLIF